MADIDADAPEEKQLYTRFENKDAFIALRDQFLAIDLYAKPSPEQDQAEGHLLQKLSNIVRCVYYDLFRWSDS